MNQTESQHVGCVGCWERDERGLSPAVPCQLSFTPTAALPADCLWLLGRCLCLPEDWYETECIKQQSASLLRSECDWALSRWLLSDRFSISSPSQPCSTRPWPAPAERHCGHQEPLGLQVYVPTSEFILCPNPVGSTALWWWGGLPVLLLVTPQFITYTFLLEQRKLFTISDEFACSSSHMSPGDFAHWSSQLYMDALQHSTGGIEIKHSSSINLSL